MLSGRARDQKKRTKHLQSQTQDFLLEAKSKAKVPCKSTNHYSHGKPHHFNNQDFKSQKRAVQCKSIKAFRLHLSAVLSRSINSAAYQHSQ